MTSNDVGQWASKQAEFQDQFPRKKELEKVPKDHNRSLTFQQIRRDGGVIVRGKYLALPYRFLTGLRETWNDMDRSRIPMPYS